MALAKQHNAQEGLRRFDRLFKQQRQARVPVANYLLLKASAFAFLTAIFTVATAVLCVFFGAPGAASGLAVFYFGKKARDAFAEHTRYINKARLYPIANLEKVKKPKEDVVAISLSAQTPTTHRRLSRDLQNQEQPEIVLLPGAIPNISDTSGTPSPRDKTASNASTNQNSSFSNRSQSRGSVSESQTASDDEKPSPTAKK